MSILNTARCRQVLLRSVDARILRSHLAGQACADRTCALSMRMHHPSGRITGHPAWKALAAHFEADPRSASACAFCRGPAARRAPDARSGRASISITPRIASLTKRCTSCGSWPKNARCGRASRRCSAATRSIAPRIVQCCTWHCARRAARRSKSMARTWCLEVHARARPDVAVRRARAQRQMERPQRPAHPPCHQYRHRRIRPGARDGVRGTQALQRPESRLSVCLQRRRHRSRRSRARSGCSADAVHCLFEDLYDFGDDDQRPQRTCLVGFRARWRRQARSPGISSRSRPMPRR